MKEIAAYQRGWNDAQDWRHTHMNPYTMKTLEWFAWEQGYEEGGLNALQAARRLKEISHAHH